MSDSDSDSPSGMRRAGYDADTQTYTYRDRRTGHYYEGQPGSRYGPLTRVSAPAYTLLEEDNSPPKSWRQENQPLLNFFLLIALFLIGVFWLMGYTSGGDGAPKVTCAEGLRSHVVRKGDTCWKIANDIGKTVEEVEGLNPGIDCGSLQLGSTVCLPGEAAD